MINKRFSDQFRRQVISNKTFARIELADWSMVSVAWLQNFADECSVSFAQLFWLFHPDSYPKGKCNLGEIANRLEEFVLCREHRDPAAK